MMTDSLLEVGHIQTGSAFNRFFFSTVKSIQISESVGQLGTSKIQQEIEMLHSVLIDTS